MMNTILDYIERTQEQIDFAKPNLENDIDRREQLMKVIEDSKIEGLEEFVDGLKEQLAHEKFQLTRVNRDNELLKQIRLEYDLCNEETKAHINAIIFKYFTILNITLDNEVESSAA